MARLGEAWYVARRGAARQGKARHGTRLGTAGPGRAWSGGAWHGEVRGAARLGVAWRGEARYRVNQEPLELNDPLVIRMVAISICLGTCGMVSCGSAIVAGDARGLVIMAIIGGLGVGIALARLVDIWDD